MDKIAFQWLHTIGIYDTIVNWWQCATKRAIVIVIHSWWKHMSYDIQGDPVRSSHHLPHLPPGRGWNSSTCVKTLVTQTHITLIDTFYTDLQGHNVFILIPNIGTAVACVVEINSAKMSSCCCSYCWNWKCGSLFPLLGRITPKWPLIWWTRWCRPSEQCLRIGQRLERGE